MMKIYANLTQEENISKNITFIIKKVDHFIVV